VLLTNVKGVLADATDEFSTINEKIKTQPDSRVDQEQRG